MDYTLTINNIPEIAYTKKYLVVCIDGRKLWYWNAYDDITDAEKSADKVFGLVIPTTKQN